MGFGADATGYANGYTEKTAYGDFVSDYLRLACARGREQGGDQYGNGSKSTFSII